MNKKLYRSRTKRTLSGVCGGLEDYFNIDVTIIRLVWVLVTIPGIVHGILAYVIAAFIIPEEPVGFNDNHYNDYNNSNRNNNEYSDADSYGYENNFEGNNDQDNMR